MNFKENLASQIHDVYMIEAERQGNTRNEKRYEDLPENVKEYDRVLVDFILKRERELLERLRIKLAYQRMKLGEYHRGGRPDEKEDLNTLRHFLIDAEIERRK